MIKIGIPTKKLKLLEGYISSAANSVLVNPQTLTDEQKQQARVNIDAMSINDVDDYMSSESINPVQNKTVKEAIDAVNDTANASALTVKQSKTNSDKYVSVLLADNQMATADAEPTENTEGGNTFVASGIAVNPATGDMTATSFSAAEDVLIGGESVKEKLSNVSVLVQDALDDMNPETLGVYTKNAIDDMVEEINTAIDGKSDADHAHTPADIGVYDNPEIDSKIADLNTTIDNLPLCGRNQVPDANNILVPVTLSDGKAPLQHVTLHERYKLTEEHPYADYEVVVGDQITFSVDIFPPADTPCYLRVDYYAEDGTIETHNGNPVTGDGVSIVGRSVVTLPVIEGYVGFRVYIASETPNAKPQYKRLKVEKGNRDTYWNDYYIRFDIEQGLTDTQKAQARANIGAGTGSSSGSGRVFSRAVNSGNINATSYTASSGLPLIYMVEISIKINSAIMSTTVMIDWNMRGNGRGYAYVLPNSSGNPTYGFLTVSSSGSGVKFGLTNATPSGHYISRVIGYY